MCSMEEPVLVVCHSCGYKREDSEHYLLFCKNYDKAREHIRNISVPISTTILLFGCNEYINEINSEIFTGVQKFILDSERFGKYQ